MPGGATRAVAVFSDASDFHREPGSSALTGLLGTAELLRDHAGMVATALLVTADSADELLAELRRVAPNVSGVYLVHTDPARGAAAQAAMGGALPLITDRQTTAVALTAAMLTTLTHAGITPTAGRVVIAGAERNPLVAELAVATGVGETYSWSLDDAHNFPLRALVRRGTVMIDLVGSGAHRRQANALDPPAPVLTVDEPTTPLLALPGLLIATQTLRRPAGIATLLATARALVERTPPGRLLPGLSDPALTEPALVAAAIAGCPAPRPPVP